MIRLRTTALLLSLLLAGCGFLSRTKSRFFTVETISPQTPVESTSGLPIGIDVIELPPGLDRREIVITKANGQLEVRERDQWSASLEPLLLHTLAHDLARRLPEGMVILPGQPVPDGPRRAVDVVVEKLTAGPDNLVRIDVRWIMRERDLLKSARREEIEIPTRSLESGEIATALSQAIAQLSDRIAAGVAGR